MGFGLSISKQLTEAMSGNIYFESQLEIGSKFTFSIPISQRLEITTGCSTKKHEESSENISPNDTILNLDMSQIPIELSETDMKLLPHILQAEVDPETEVKFCESAANPRLLLENLKERSEENNSEIVTESPKVLIVDDTSINVFALQMLLSKLKVKSDSVRYSLYIYIYIFHRQRTDWKV